MTSGLAEDASLINGVATESIGPQVEGLFAMGTGVIIGFIFNWKMALIAMGLAPFMAVGNALAMKFQAGAGEVNEEELKQAQLLCGDAIVNYKTVQSFANE